MKHSWSKLKQEYLKGKYGSLKTFAEKKGIPYSSLSKKAKNWRKIGKEIEEKGDEKTVEKLSDKVAEYNLKHMKLFQDVIDHGSGHLPNLDYESAAGAVQAIRVGVEGQRDILLPKGVDTEVHVTVNIPRPYRVGPNGENLDDQPEGKAK